MKKIFSILTLSLLLTGGSLFSQSRISLGLSGTFLSSALTNQNHYGLSDMDYAFTLGGSGSVHFGFDFNKNLGVALQVGYANLGQNYTDVIKDTNYIRNVQLNYLQIPLMFKYRTNGEVIRFYGMVGPQLNYLLSATQTYLKQEMEYNPDVYNDITKSWVKVGESTITERYNSIDVFVRMDLGVEFTITPHLWANAGFSMGYGLLDVNASDWQIKDADGNYNPSHNVFGGFNCGINYNF